MGWAKRLIEYSLVVIVAIIVSFLLIWFLFPRNAPCTNCVVSMPQTRAECDKQFFSSGSRARQLDAGAEDEFLVAYVDAPPSQGAGGGYSPPSGGYSSATSPASATVRGPGFVMVRAQPQFGYDYSGNQTSYGSSNDTSTTQPETSWDDAVCGQTALRFREGKFETYCEIPNQFTQADGGQLTYRIFVRNESSVPLEYCIVSNCDASAPYGAGSLCQMEQPPAQ